MPLDGRRLLIPPSWHDLYSTLLKVNAFLRVHAAICLRVAVCCAGCASTTTIPLNGSNFSFSPTFTLGSLDALPSSYASTYSPCSLGFPDVEAFGIPFLPPPPLNLARPVTPRKLVTPVLYAYTGLCFMDHAFPRCVGLIIVVGGGNHSRCQNGNHSLSLARSPGTLFRTCLSLRFCIAPRAVNPCCTPTSQVQRYRAPSSSRNLLLGDQVVIVMIKLILSSLLRPFKFVVLRQHGSNIQKAIANILFRFRFSCEFPLLG